MGKRKGDQPNSQAKDPVGSTPETAPAQPEGAPADIIVKIEPPPVTASVVATPVAAKPEAPPPPTEKPSTIGPAVAATGAFAAWLAMPAWLKMPSMPRMPRFTPLAATIAVATIVGATAGSMTTAALAGWWSSPPPPTKTVDTRPLSDAITRINSELAALKTSVEISGRTANGQLAKLGDRFDRLERAQAEPAARLARLSAAVERLDRRAPAVAAPSDVTGSIATPSPQPGAAAVRPAGPPVLDGWVVRSVYNGAALIQTRYGGVLEVEPGDNLPGLGRIENIRRQDGRWVVVTSRGMIVAR